MSRFNFMTLSVVVAAISVSVSSCSRGLILASINRGVTEKGDILEPMGIAYEVALPDALPVFYHRVQVVDGLRHGLTETVFLPSETAFMAQEFSSGKAHGAAFSWVEADLHDGSHCLVRVFSQGVPLGNARAVDSSSWSEPYE
jgi:hypothetical protein